MDNDSHPWEDLFVGQELDFAIYNPYVVPEIQQLPDETPAWPDIPDAMSKSADIFAKVPLEIIDSITLQLPTVDYLNARLALPSLFPVFYDRHFWASRFLPNADRSWVFESQNWKMARDWLWLYRRTANGSPKMKNCRRVWRLVEKVKELLCLEWAETVSRSIADVTNTNWLRVAADIRPDNLQPPYHQRFDGGCRQLREKQVCVPPGQLSHLAFSLVWVGDATYITGIRLILRDGDIRLGYMADEEHILNITYLTGFNVAVGSRGIQGIQCVLDDDRESPWIGCPDDAPKTKHLRFLGAIKIIKAAFDVSSFFFLLVSRR